MAYPYYTEPTHIAGSTSSAVKTTKVGSDEGRLIVDAVDKIMLLEPNKHPLVSLLTSVGKVYDGKSWKGAGLLKASTGNPEFNWFEDFYGGRYATVNMGGGYNNTDDPVTIDVDGAGIKSARIFTVGDVVKNAVSGENMIVASIADDDTITCTRAFGSTVATAGVDDDGLFIIGNVNEENAGARNVNMTQIAKKTNYTQIFKETITVSGTQREANLYGGKDLPFLRAKHGTQHALDIERAFWFGEAKEDVVTGHPKRATGGVLEYILSEGAYTQDASAGGAALTVSELNTFFREGFTYGSDSKYLFASGVLLQIINEYARGQIQMKPLAKSYGMQIGTWVTAFGTVHIVHNPLFVQAYSGIGFLLDLDCFRYRYMNNRDTRLELNVQAPDVDGQIDQYITECGLERKQAAKNAYLYDVTT